MCACVNCFPTSFSLFLCVLDVVSAGQCRETEQQRKVGERTCQQKAKVLITYWSNLADDSLKRQRAAQCTAQKEREETIYCSKVPWTLICASLNVYYQFLASVPCLAALTTTLSLHSYLALLFSLFYSRSALSAFILSFTSHLCFLSSHFFSLLSIPCCLQSHFLGESVSVSMSLML